MKTFQKLYVALLLFTPFLANAQATSIFNGVSMLESKIETENKLNGISTSISKLSFKKPSFPLAKDSEGHLICANIRTENGIIEKAVFTFGDDKLKYIKATGNVYEVFTAKRNDTAIVHQGYDIYMKDKLFLKKEEDAAWIITDEGMWASLFLWNNPYLDSTNLANERPSNIDQNLPTFLKMGASMEEMKPLLEAYSAFTSVQELDGSDPNAQIQINAFGVNYLGYPRKIEARFGDDILNVVWILTGKQEEERIRQALIKQYGQPIFVNDEWEVFNNWQVGLRKDKPEILLAEEKVGLMFKTQYFKQ